MKAKRIKEKVLLFVISAIVLICFLLLFGCENIDSPTIGSVPSDSETIPEKPIVKHPDVVERLKIESEPPEIAGTKEKYCLPAGFPTTYDKLIKSAWIKHGGIDWSQWHCGFRAQLAKESSLREDAESSAGAVGIGQQLVTAADDCHTQGGLTGNRRQAKFSILCSAWIMRRNGNIWKSPRPHRCRLELARLSYVSGAGHGIRAQKAARAEGHSAVCVDDGILDYMDRVVHEDAAKEARGYITSIRDIERIMTPKD